ncbi:MAG: NAD(P)/FAD-dependent oxidoreductase [Nitrospinae bacterium]|nr:NAD(P)/FAD-dependent oxidoreductase [Nitrospinota bacterium]
MLKIFFAFVPWSMFWSYSFAGEPRSAALWALALCAVLLAVNYKKPKMFEIASTAFFVFAWAFPPLDREIVTLSYLWLALVAAAPPFLGRTSFTAQYIAETVPASFAKNPIFRKINDTVSLLWGAIFLASAVADHAGHFLLPAALITCGILFSIAYPVIAPGWLMTADMRKYRWKAAPSRHPAGPDEFSAIIIGSGIGGLSCAALLAKMGYKPLVLEQHSQPGGYCTSFRRNGFEFSAGVETISGLSEKGPVTFLLNTLGFDPKEMFVKNRQRFIMDGTSFDWPGTLDETIALLAAKYPAEADNLRRFFADAALALAEPYADNPLGVPMDEVAVFSTRGWRGFAEFARRYRHLPRWMIMTYREKLDEYFADECLKDFLGGLSGFVGTEPDKTPAMAALFSMVSYFVHGGYHPKGGAQKFADRLAEYITAHGGTVLLRHRATKIHIERGRVTGATANGRLFRSSVAVSNADPVATFTQLAGREHFPNEFLAPIENLKMSTSAFMVFLGVGMDLSAYPALINDLDGKCGIFIDSNADASLAPKGMATLSIIRMAEYDDYPPRGTTEYEEKKQKDADELIARAEKVIPGISQKIFVREAATPRTFERYVLHPKGALYSFDQSAGTKRPYFKTPVEGLYLAGAGPFGGGVEAVAISGMIAAYDITGWTFSESR